MSVVLQENERTIYFFEQVEQNTEDKTRIDTDSVKNTLSEQRRIFRDAGGKKEFLEMIASNDFESIYKNIDIELKQSKEKNKKIKDKIHHKKEEKRKIRIDNKKLISEIFKLKQEIGNQKLNLDRLNSESLALKNKQEKKMIVNNKYDINSLIDETQCKNIVNNQRNTLNNINNDMNNNKKIYDKQKEINNELNNKNEILNKKIQSFKDINQFRTENNSELNVLQNKLESMKRLLNIPKLEIDNNSNKLHIEYKSESNKMYTIEIEIETYQRNENKDSIDYMIKSLQITNGNNTKFNDIAEWVMSKNKLGMRNGNVLIRANMIVIKSVIIEVLLCLSKLHLRYIDINKLFDIYGGNDGMLPWLPENGQLVFKFSFKQKIKGNEMDVVEVDVPLVVSMSWNYPQDKCIMDDNVISIEHYNCNLRQNNGDDEKRMDMQGKWKHVLEKVVSDVKGRYQNDIVGFLNFIYNQLQRFAGQEQ